MAGIQSLQDHSRGGGSWLGAHNELVSVQCHDKFRTVLVDCFPHQVGHDLCLYLFRLEDFRDDDRQTLMREVS